MCVYIPMCISMCVHVDACLCVEERFVNNIFYTAKR